MQPPIFLRGWCIDLDSYTEKARARGLEEYLFQKIFPPDWATHKDRSTIVREKVLDRISSCEKYVRTVIEEDLNIRNLPVRMYIGIGLGCTSDKKHLDVRYVLTLYDNYNVDDKPSEEDEKKIRDALELTDDPGWFADGNFHWFFWDDESDYDYF